MEKRQAYPHLLRRDAISAGESTFSHPWNPWLRNFRHTFERLAGLERTGVSLVRPAAGKESFAYL